MKDKKEEFRKVLKEMLKKYKNPGLAIEKTVEYLNNKPLKGKIKIDIKQDKQYGN